MRFINPKKRQTKPGDDILKYMFWIFETKQKKTKKKKKKIDKW